MEANSLQQEVLGKRRQGINPHRRKEELNSILFMLNRIPES
jgi:hypothetical protein